MALPGSQAKATLQSKRTGAGRGNGVQDAHQTFSLFDYYYFIVMIAAMNEFECRIPIKIDPGLMPSDHERLCPCPARGGFSARSHPSRSNRRVARDQKQGFLHLRHRYQCRRCLHALCPLHCPVTHGLCGCSIIRGWCL